MRHLISVFYQTFIYQPLFNALILIYNFLPGHDLGLAIIILTSVIKLLTFPLNVKSARAQQAMARVQPQIKEVQKRYANNPQEQSRAVSEIFKREKVNPLANMLPLLIQLPIMIALYQLFLKGLWSGSGILYSFVVKPAEISPLFFGIVDLSKPNIVLAILAGAAQLLQSLTMPVAAGQGDKDDPKYKMSRMMQKQMMFFLPVFITFTLLKLSSVLGLYWLTSSLLGAWQQYVLNKKFSQVKQ